MRSGPRVLLINPTITSARSARFPLAVLSLATALEGRYQWQIIDGNVDRDFIASSVHAVGKGDVCAVGITVMGGPQLVSAIAVSKAIRERSPATPIIWGGYFPTICPEASLRVPYVDHAIRGQGEAAFRELLDRLQADAGGAIPEIAGLSWKQGGIVHNPARTFSAASLANGLLYDRLDNPWQYLPRTFLGRRTAGYQAALGCRFRCTFCGVAAQFRGKTALPQAARLEQDLTFLQQQLGADSIQFYDHNFFDRETDMQPLLDVLAKFQLPWWCYARSDALAALSPASWERIRRSRLRMAYIGAESPSDWLLHDVRKGTHSDQTLAAVEACRSNGVIPELSFMLAPPQDPEGETERTFDFIRHIKRAHPATEIVIYVYTPLPPAADGHGAGTRAPFVPRDVHGVPVPFPLDADEWAQPRWLDYWCHADAPWLTDRLRRRIRDFTTVLGCRFPTATDVRTGVWGKSALRVLSSWRYRFARYGNPRELHAAKRVIRLRDPRVSSL